MIVCEENLNKIALCVPSMFYVSARKSRLHMYMFVTEKTLRQSHLNVFVFGKVSTTSYLHVFVLKKHQQNRICVCLCWKSIRKIAFACVFVNKWQQNRCFDVFCFRKITFAYIIVIDENLNKIAFACVFVEENVKKITRAYVFVQKRQENHACI